jgi:hypothetical protein
MVDPAPAATEEEERGVARETQVKISASQTERINGARAVGLINTDTTAFVRQCVDEGLKRLAQEKDLLAALDRYIELQGRPMREALSGPWGNKKDKR